MSFEKTYIPYDAYWSTPFCRWQGNFAHLHSMKFAAEICRGALPARRIPLEIFDGLVLGMTIPQKSCFYGAPWMAAMIGAPGITGPAINQACATSARCLAAAAGEIEMENNKAILVVTCDRVGRVGEPSDVGDRDGRRYRVRVCVPHVSADGPALHLVGEVDDREGVEAR